MLLRPRHAIAFIERDLADDAALAEGLCCSALDTRGLRRFNIGRKDQARLVTRPTIEITLIMWSEIPCAWFIQESSTPCWRLGSAAAGEDPTGRTADYIGFAPSAFFS